MSGPSFADGCEPVREVAPDLALGLLTGEARAAVLAHLEGCEACRAEVAALAGAADEVLLAAPEATPPAGFADRVLAAVSAEAARTGRSPATPAGLDVPAPGVGRTPRRRRTAPPGSRGLRPARARSRRRPVVIGLAAAAAVAVLAVVAAVGLGGDRSGDGDEVVTAVLRTGPGRAVGEVTLSGDDPVEVAVDMPEWDALVERWEGEASGDYWLAIETRDGERTMRPVPGDDGGDDGWTTTVEAGAGEVAAVSVVDGEGRIWCSTTFPA